MNDFNPLTPQSPPYPLNTVLEREASLPPRAESSDIVPRLGRSWQVRSYLPKGKMRPRARPRSPGATGLVVGKSITWEL